MRLIRTDTVADLKDRRAKRKLARQRIMAGVPTEDQEQISLFRWADIAERYQPELEMLFSIANEGGRLKNLRFAGVKKGVSDIFLSVPRGIFHGLYIEMKRRKGGKVEPEQYEWIAKAQKYGYSAQVAWGWDEAREQIVEYLKLRGA